MSGSSIIGILAALACLTAGACLGVTMLLLGRIGELQTEADAENEPFPGPDADREALSASGVARRGGDFSRR